MDRKLLSAVAALTSTAACFDPDIDFCAPCAAAGGCPEGAACVMGLCVFEDQRCVARLPDASTESADAASPVTEPEQATCSPEQAEATCADASAPVTELDQTACSSEHEQAECWDRCCIGSQLHEFPDSLKEGLVLWLDASYLPGLAPGDPLDVWRDRSSGKHDARASSAAPLVGVNSIQIDDPSQTLAVAHHARHDLSTEDFALLLAFSLPAPAQFQCLVAKTVPRESGFYVSLDKLGALVLTLNGDCGVPDGCPRLRSSAAALTADRLQLLGIRRIHGARLELRLNGEVAAHAQLGLDHSLASAAPLVLGSCGPEDGSYFQGSLFAAILVRATVSDADLAALESYLVSAFEAAP